MDEVSMLVAKLRQDGEKLNSYLLPLNEQAQLKVVYTEGAVWTVRSVLAHLMSAEKEFLRLFQEIQRGGGGVEEGFSIDRFNAHEQARYEQLTWEETLVAFRDVRGEMVRLVAAFSAADLERTARHPHLGITNLREMVKMIYIHDQIHLRDIRRAVGPG
ncbi:MAG TPA: DinB family protein [Anaerolineales bacterium]|nr:DinB family protein [Anaerolineales bacterium]